MSDWLTRTVNGMVAAKPRFNGPEAAMRREHKQWLRRAELGRPYYGEDAKYEWIGPEWGPFELYCSDRWVFTERRDHALYTAEGISSWDAWWSCGPKGLTRQEPPRPLDRPVGFMVRGGLGDDSRKWSTEYYTR